MKRSEIHDLGPLFAEVQLRNVLGDGKTFPDCISKRPLGDINAEYLKLKDTEGFDLQEFTKSNFDLPKAYSSDFKSDRGRPIRQHIEALWDILTRNPDHGKSSLIPLPFPYVVPGGRFREIYYWDSYFTMLGLSVSNRTALIQNMVDNFSYLIDHIGYIPNGNRTYFIGRSQPPFYSLMVKLLSLENGQGREILIRYLPQLEKEYQFWMTGSESLTETHPANARVVRMGDGTILNRYWDENTTPRPEAYKEDLELSEQALGSSEELFRHLRAAAESGWDFSSRWFKDSKSFATIHTTDIIPVDLNCLILHLEQVIAEGHQLSNNMKSSVRYLTLAENRKRAIERYCWDQGEKFYFDYDLIEKKRKNHLTLAAAFPLFFGVASAEQAENVADVLRKRFLKAGGLTTTIEVTGQQWDAPNGWAPLQWIACKGLSDYGFRDLANLVKARWMSVNLKVFQKTGKLTEKYDVWNEAGEASGGEYPNQDGFGWTNGVFLAMEDFNF